MNTILSFLGLLFVLWCYDKLKAWRESRSHFLRPLNIEISVDWYEFALQQKLLDEKDIEDHKKRWSNFWCEFYFSFLPKQNLYFINSKTPKFNSNYVQMEETVDNLWLKKENDWDTPKRLSVSVIGRLDNGGKLTVQVGDKVLCRIPSTIFYSQDYSQSVFTSDILNEFKKYDLEYKTHTNNYDRPEENYLDITNKILKIYVSRGDAV